MLQDHTARLPPELLQQITQDLGFTDLIPLLATSRRWREIALDSRAYWQSIDLTVASDGAANLFLTRISRTFGRPFALAVHIHTEWSNLERTFPAIQAHLHHITRLDLQVQEAQSSGLLSILCSPAILLGNFHFAVTPTHFDAPLSRFPPDLFGGHAPSLRTVSFCNMLLPEESPVRAFCTVVGVGLAYYTIPESRAPDVFPHFPNLLEYRIQGLFSLLLPVYLKPSSWSAVKVIRLNLEGTADVVKLDLLSLSRVPFVEIKFPSRVHIQPLLSHIIGDDSHVMFYDRGTEMFSVDLSNADGTLTRSMLMSKGSLDDRVSFQYELFTVPDVAHRVASIELDCSLWDVIMEPLPELPLIKLVHVDFAETIPPLHAVFECPRLIYLVFQSRVGRWRRLAADMFTEFARLRLRRVCFPIEIGLKNVELDFTSNDESMLEDFKRVFSLIKKLD